MGQSVSQLFQDCISVMNHDLAFDLYAPLLSLAVQ